MNEKGFTLLELVITMVLMAVLSVTVIARWPSEAINLDALSEQVTRDIRLMQSLAMSRGERFQIHFTADGYQLRYLDNSPFYHPGAGNHQLVMPDGVNLTASQSTLVFSSLGTPYTNTNIPGTALSTNATVTLTLGSESRIITIHPETGYVQ